MALIAWDDDPVNANSYVTQAAATAYFADAIHAAAWSAADSTTKDQALVTATRTLDRSAWAGTKTLNTQPLEWPRSGASDRDGNTLADDDIPTEIREGTYEMAIVLVQNSGAQAGSPSVRTISTGKTSVTFANPTARSSDPFPAIVCQLVCPLLASAQSSSALPVAYGVDEDDNPPVLAEEDKWDRTEPF
jgi:hypothetical protein